MTHIWALAAVGSAISSDVSTLESVCGLVLVVVVLLALAKSHKGDTAQAVKVAFCVILALIGLGLAINPGTMDNWATDIVGFIPL